MFRSERSLKRNQLPAKADVLFIGEAPGLSEDGLGKPFLGPAGDRFDLIVEDVYDWIGKFTWMVTNTIACTPYEEGSHNNVGKPKQPHMKACMPRVIELLNILEPKCVILLGNEAEKGWKLIHTPNFKRKFPFTSIPHLKVAHPSWIEHYCAEPETEHKRAVLAMKTFIPRYEVVLTPLI